MSTGQSIEHKGIIDEISRERIRVKFTSLSACAECHAKGVCSASDMQEKEIEINHTEETFKKGETVDVIMERSLGMKAVLFGYVYPFLLVLFLLVILIESGTGELQSGLIALSVLIPYYFLVYSFREIIGRKFNFTIRKIQ